MTGLSATANLIASPVPNEHHPPQQTVTFGSVAATPRGSRWPIGSTFLRRHCELDHCCTVLAPAFQLPTAMETPAIKTRFNAIGVVGVAPERRGPEYLARYVVEEIARWEGPIKAAGLQVD